MNGVKAGLLIAESFALIAMLTQLLLVLVGGQGQRCRLYPPAPGARRNRR